MGYNHTEETKEKIALGQKGRKRSEETKRRMSEAKRLYWEERRKFKSKLEGDKEVGAW